MAHIPVLNLQAAYKSELLAQVLTSQKLKTLSAGAPMGVDALSELLNYDFKTSATDVIMLDQAINMLDKIDADSLKYLDSIIMPLEIVKYVNLFVQ